MPMKAEIKAQWIKALRSGKYKQGRGALRKTDNTYCCLGVLCDLAIKAGLEVEVEAVGTANYYNFDGECSYLPTVIADWAGIDFLPSVANARLGRPKRLDILNDGDEGGLTAGGNVKFKVKPLGFRKIAALIEADASL